jgi:aminoglycoside phosphotransferase (APT) family kinase protein
MVATQRLGVPLSTRREGQEMWLLLEDLDAVGFSARLRSGSSAVVLAGIEWLAAFHAAHLGRAPDGLWREGSYWHLETRREELGAIVGHPLHRLAPELDARLRGAKHRTLVHGDPKLENFCVAPGPAPRLAAVDFQYVGGGVGVRDLVYFIGSALAPARVERELPALVDMYFESLRCELEQRDFFRVSRTNWKPNGASSSRWLGSISIASRSVGPRVGLRVMCMRSGY